MAAIKAVPAGQQGQQSETMEQRIARLEKENEALKARVNKPLTLKVGEKGGVSVYGLGRFPVTLYGEQWARLLNFSEEIRSFLKANADKLSTKPQAQ